MQAFINCPYLRLRQDSFELSFALWACICVLALSESSFFVISGKIENSHREYPFRVKHAFLLLGQKPILSTGICRGQIRLSQRYSRRLLFISNLLYSNQKLRWIRRVLENQYRVSIPDLILPQEEFRNRNCHAASVKVCFSDPVASNRHQRYFKFFHANHPVLKLPTMFAIGSNLITFTFAVKLFFDIFFDFFYLLDLY